MSRLSRLRSPMALTAELVTRCHRSEPDPGPNPQYTYFTDRDYDTAATMLLQQKPLDASLDICLRLVDLEAGLRHRRTSASYRLWLAPCVLSGADTVARLCRTAWSHDGPGAGRPLRWDGLPAATDGRGKATRPIDSPGSRRSRGIACGSLDHRRHRARQAASLSILGRASWA